MKLLNGVINLGGSTKTVFQFAKKYNPKIKKISVKSMKNLNFSRNLNEYNKLKK